jgi:hypothetical protein
VPSLVVADGRTARRRVADHSALFGRFEVRGRAVEPWLREPVGTIGGILTFATVPDSNHRRLGQAGRRRISRQPGT